MPKNIVLFSDGTGNSAGKLFRTNIWRFYQALDLTDPSKQVALYDDGVGTSSFRPLALLGGVFGFGLKRNVLDLYTFLCRNYVLGDRIYVFGFSRGAFTARVLTGLVALKGLPQCDTEEERQRYARDAYRSFRHHFNRTKGVVGPLRWVRDAAVIGWRRLRRHRTYDEVTTLPITRIEFVGVWDTVAAYGAPVAEITRAIDDWIWPLSMPDYDLCRKVARARHALALDDERDTFHPLIWNEAPETDPDRIRQVWFAGVHSNLGGGYADDALSLVSLDWMMTEAKGLHLKPGAHAEIRAQMNPNAPIYDSRAGLAGYYRYQPRKISARLDPPDPTTQIMRDPDPTQRAVLKRVFVHDSVLQRIQSGPDHYAPIVLPDTYHVIDTKGAITPSPESNSVARAAQQERVWDDVWHRRISYFLTLGVSLLLVSMPRWATPVDAETCSGPHCLAVPAIRGAGDFLPGFAQPWVNTFANAPLTFLILAGLLAALLLRSASLERQLRGRMHDLWIRSLSPQGGVTGPAPNSWVYRLRSKGWYQGTLQWFKWIFIPGSLGALTLLFLLLYGPALISSRVLFPIANALGGICSGSSEPRTFGSEGAFPAASLCWESGVQLEQGRTYRIALTLPADWRDGSFRAGPNGVLKEMPWYVTLFGTPLRRSVTHPWFAIFARTGARFGDERVMTFEQEGNASIARLTPETSGPLYLFVNDAIFGIPVLADIFYRSDSRFLRAKNQGVAKVIIEPDV
jgi:uncharacterized protein (DUF2235 family)